MAIKKLYSSDSRRKTISKLNNNFLSIAPDVILEISDDSPTENKNNIIWIDTSMDDIIKEIDTQTYANEYFASHPEIDRSTFKYIGDDGKPTLEFKKMIYGDDYKPSHNYILKPKNKSMKGFCKPIKAQNNTPLFDLSGITFDTSGTETFREAFYDAPNLEKINVSDWDTSKATDFYGLFGFAVDIKKLDLSKWNTSKVTTMEKAFLNCAELVNLDVSRWDTSNVTNMNNIFAQNPKLTTLDISKWNTSKVVDMGSMFNIDSKINNLNLSNWNVSQVKNMERMFSSCSSLTNIGDISNWDTRNVTTIESMFSQTTKLANLNLSNWNTSKLNIASYVFSSMFNLKTLDISNWDTSNVTSMQYFVTYNNNLTTINGVIDFKSCTSYVGMFYGCTKLTSVKVKNLPVDIDTFCNTANIDKSKVIVVE